MVNYQNGNIYKIEDMNGEMCYIGSTTKDMLCQTMAEHRKMYKCFKNGKTNNFTVFDIFEKYGVEQCRIVLIELCPCNTKDELTSRESHYIRTMDCVNKMIPNRTRKERMEQPQYKETKHSYDQTHYAENKEHITNTVKIYYEKNVDAIKQKRKEVIDCTCGITYTKCNRAQHFKSKYHIEHVVDI